MNRLVAFGDGLARFLGGLLSLCLVLTMAYVLVTVSIWLSSTIWGALALGVGIGFFLVWVIVVTTFKMP